MAAPIGRKMAYRVWYIQRASGGHQVASFNLDVAIFHDVTVNEPDDIEFHLPDWPQRPPTYLLNPEQALSVQQITRSAAPFGTPHPVAPSPISPSAPPAPPRGVRWGRGRADRKSTRLNSSH